MGERPSPGNPTICESDTNQKLDARQDDDSPTCCKRQGTKHFLDGSSHFLQLIFWQRSEHFSTLQITDKSLQQGLTCRTFTSSLFRIIKIENCTVVMSTFRQEGHLQIDETNSCDHIYSAQAGTTRRARFLESSRLHDPLTFPACSINRTIHLTTPVWIQPLSTKPKQVLKIVLKIYGREHSRASPMTKGRQRIRPICLTR